MSSQTGEITRKKRASIASPSLLSTLTLLEELDKDIRSRPPEPEFPTGIPLLDEMTYGLHRGEMAVMASRPGGGKTSLALFMAFTMAQKGKKVLFFSIEMTPESLLERLFCLVCEIDGWTLRTGRPDAEYDKKLKDFKEILSTLPLQIIQWGYEIGQIPALLNDYERSGKMPDAVIIDHLMMVETDPKDDRRSALNAYLMELRRYIQEHNIATLVITQLNRDAKNKPSMSNLKETGFSEEAAQLVLLLWWKGREDKTDPTNPEYHIIIDKQRHGPVGEIIIEFHPSTFKFVATKTIPEYQENRYGQ